MSNLDLECINNLVLKAAKKHMESNVPKTRGELEKANDQPVCDVSLVTIMIKEAVNQLIERQDNLRFEDSNAKDVEITGLKGTIAKLQKENSELQQIIEDTAQYNRRDNLTIVGYHIRKMRTL